MRTFDYLLAILVVILSGCKGDIKVDSAIDAMPDIYPDYADVTVPCNIAPLNFYINGDADEYAVRFDYGDDSDIVRSSSGDVVIPPRLWHDITASRQCDSVSVTVCERRQGRWSAFKPFAIHVAGDSISSTLVYRLIPPLYGTWREIGIYQRDLESYDESPIYENVAYHGNCVNCHSFCLRQPDKMLMHLRGPGAGTYMIREGLARRLDTKTDSTIANFTYPYWHPSGRYVAFSVNDIFQVFHTSDPNRTEVIDDASDIVIYDVDSNTAFSSGIVKAPGRLETFPAFTADGNALLYCSAAKPDSLPEQYGQVRYSLCSVPFDPSAATIGDKADTLFNACAPIDSIGLSGSMSFPRPSPDGRWLVSTLSGYGNFSIWHKDADLWIMDMATKQWRPLAAANSDDVESYHSWSGNSRWLVFSSRRDDGLYTRPYITYISPEGVASKPFMLPQKYPKRYYTDQQNSFNIPELVDGHVDVDTRRVVDLIGQPSAAVVYRGQ